MNFCKFLRELAIGFKGSQDLATNPDSKQWCGKNWSIELHERRTDEASRGTCVRKRDAAETTVLGKLEGEDFLRQFTGFYVPVPSGVNCELVLAM